jgi:hypothetical protein
VCIVLIIVFKLCAESVSVDFIFSACFSVKEVHDTVDGEQSELFHLLVGTGLYFTVFVDQNVGATKLVGWVSSVVSEARVLLNVYLTAVLVLEKAELRANLFVVDGGLHSLVTVKHRPESSSGVCSDTWVLLSGL